MTTLNPAVPESQWPSVYERRTSTTYAHGAWTGAAQYEIPGTSCNRVRYVDQAWIDMDDVASDPANLLLLRVKVGQTVAAAISAGQFLTSPLTLSSATLAGVQTNIALLDTSEHRKLDPGDTLWIVNTSTTAASGGMTGMRVGVGLRDVQF